MAGVLALVVVAAGTAFLLPRAGVLVTRHATSTLGRTIGTWAVFAVVYDLFITGDRPFTGGDAAITGAAAVLANVVM